MIRQCMSVLRKEAQLAQHKPLDRLEEVSRHVAGSRGGRGCDVQQGLHTQGGGGAVMCDRVTQGWGWGCDVWQGHTGVGVGL